MTQQLFIWFAVVIAMAAALAARSMHRFHVLHRIRHGLHRFVKVGTEEEMLYCPGDVFDSEEL